MCSKVRSNRMAAVVRAHRGCGDGDNKWGRANSNKSDSGGEGGADGEGEGSYDGAGGAMSVSGDEDGDRDIITAGGDGVGGCTTSGVVMQLEALATTVIGMLTKR